MAAAQNKRPLIVICGPSGAGKDKLLAMLRQDDPERYEYPVGYTTRAIRSNETQDVSYHFISRAAFEDKIKAGDFIEYIEIHGNLYGLDKQSIEEIYQRGKQCILILDPHGCEQFRALGMDPRIALVQVPTLSDLRTRLEKRGTESAALIETRMQTAQKELAYYESHMDMFDQVVMNVRLDDAFQRLKNWIHSLDEGAFQHLLEPCRVCIRLNYSVSDITCRHLKFETSVNRAYLQHMEKRYTHDKDAAHYYTQAIAALDVRTPEQVQQDLKRVRQHQLAASRYYASHCFCPDIMTTRTKCTCDSEKRLSALQDK